MNWDADCPRAAAAWNTFRFCPLSMAIWILCSFKGVGSNLLRMLMLLANVHALLSQGETS
jgi:hypothetical protein